MNNKMKLMITAGVLMLQPISVFAQSSGSHGGDSRCQEFYTLASEISVALAKIGQANVSKVNPLIEVAFTRQQMMRPLTVLPAHGLPRQALSNPNSDSTQLDVEQWDAIKLKNKKVALVAHELMVLIRAEADGEYSVSADVVKLLRANQFESLNSGTLQMTPDGAVIIKDPNVAMKSISGKVGIGYLCEQLGFDKGISGTLRRARKNEEILILNPNENLSGSYVEGNLFEVNLEHTIVYKSVTCR